VQRGRDMKRRAFLGLAAFGGVFGMASAISGRPALRRSVAPPRIKESDLEEMTLADLQGAMQSGKSSALSLAKKYLARIEEIDQRGPTLRAVIEINPDALALARELDRERKAKGPRGSLHGIPVLLKDNIATRDRMSTTAGSLALVGAVPPRDAFLVQKLREAGAVILGKSNLSEWANFRSSRSTSGWSGRGGLTRNPCVLDRNPSGSSSGSAVAVAANLCAVAVGTETDGSILSPASYNGIVGLKPTVGLVSRSGIIPISHTQDTAGPMARTVTDAAILLGCMVGSEPRDPATTAAAGKMHPDYTRFLDAGALRGARIGVPRKLFGGFQPVQKLAEAALGEMKSRGAVLVDSADLPSHGKWGNAEYEVMLYEFKAGVNACLASLEGNPTVRSLAEVIKFNERNREHEMPYFGQEILAAAEAKGPLTEPAYRDAFEKCRRVSRAEGIDAVMDPQQLDALVAPTTGPAHVTDLVYGDRSTGGSTTPAAVAGYPSITVPMGFVSGLPVGISFFGRAWSEPKLIALAFAFEQATRVRKPPGFLPTAGPVPALG
jgi:amidase